ncbi:MAG: hypothetical protein JXB24_11050 [Bacteroidales bacterium]|nr:hypothetical protein [Bacteroidales bacterium]
MKNFRTLILVVFITAVFAPITLNAQEEAAKEEKGSPFSVGVDLVSSYVWRGSKYGGPSLQPYVEFGIAGFAIGAWGSFGIGPPDETVNEADLYLGYIFDFGLSIGLTDYYYQGNPFFEYSDTISSHAFESNLTYEIGGFSIAANFIFNDTHAGAGSSGDDIYFEAGYSFGNFNIFLGAGDGWHTTDGEFNICNIGIGTSKEIKITENFSLPVSGQVVLNPEAEEFNLVVGISF